jgi:hypothetical protein
MAKEKEVESLIEDDEEELKDSEYVVVEDPIKDEDDDEEESNLKSSEEESEASSEEDREAIRERRRLEKKERKERRDKAIGRDKIELNFLRSRNDELERRIGAVEAHTKNATITDTDRLINEAVNEVSAAERIIAKAVEAGNGEDVTKAMRYRDQAIAKVQQLNQYKQQQTQPEKENRQQVDSEVAHYAKEFMEEHSWYDPSGKDEDSAIVLAIDNKLAQEGFDPRSEEYWDELHDRIKRRLPEKFKAARKPTGGPAIGSGREHAPVSTRKEIYISPDRKAALIEAGAWDDPVLRQRYIKRYAEYDRANKS